MEGLSTHLLVKYDFYYSQLMENYSTKIELARNKKSMYFKLLRKVSDDYLNYQNEFQNNGWDLFKLLDESLEEDKTLSLEDALFKYTKNDELEVKLNKVKNLAIIRAHSDFIDWLKTNEADKSTPDFDESKAKKGEVLVKWTNGNNKTDFVKLIYSFHHAGLINNGHGEITKIVEALGKTFNVELGENWEANHSENKRIGNGDKQFAIFDRIKDSYKKYVSAIDK